VDDLYPFLDDYAGKFKDTTTAQDLKDLVDLLYPFNYSVSGNDSHKVESTMLSLISFRVTEFPSFSNLRGWQIPAGWDVDEAKIYHDGKCIYDCLKHTKLGCAYLSPSFSGVVSRKELQQHCTWREDLPGATVYDWTRLYRIAKRKDWGLSIPKAILDQLPSDQLEIVIKTSTYPSSMKVYDFLLPGTSDREIIINAHNCHPYQANDDVSGCAIGIALIKTLSAIKTRRYSYRLLIAPELFGPMFWLEDHIKDYTKVKGAILLKSLGNSEPLQLQKSFNADTVLDIAAQIALKIDKSDQRTHSFRSYYGNDETVFEAPGIEIPSITFTRFPFLQYHTDQDIPGIIDTQSLLDSYKSVLECIRLIESDAYATRVETGLYCLSNPIYDLYKSAPEPGISNAGISSYAKTWNLLMNCFTRELHAGKTLLQIASEYKIPALYLIEYAKEWHQKGLISLSYYD